MGVVSIYITGVFEVELLSFKSLTLLLLYYIYLFLVLQN